jgi:hypothetical protein
MSLFHSLFQAVAPVVTRRFTLGQRAAALDYVSQQTAAKCDQLTTSMNSWLNTYHTHSVPGYRQIAAKNYHAIKVELAQKVEQLEEQLQEFAAVQAEIRFLSL